MDCSNVHEEYIEVVWTILEKGSNSLAQLEEKIGALYDDASLDQLVDDGIVILDRDAGTLAFTESGEVRARQLIRSHRIAERLISDVLGGEYEDGACEFEHIKNPVLVDSICTLLGHPRECPHGLPIPGGECCRRSADVVQRSVVPLTSLESGSSAVIAYVYSKNDGQLHILEGMQLRPGMTVKLHQKKPTYVIEVEDAHIAIDPDVAMNIQVWIDNSGTAPGNYAAKPDVGSTIDADRKKKRRWWQI
jgi:DtxR family Mn-dependent transcriptional regulator